jgi:hypothetical protein
MKASEAEALLTSLLNNAEKACEIAKIAVRNRKSLAGDNPYGNRFHEMTVALSTTEGKLRPVLNGLALSLTDLERFNCNLSVVKDTAVTKPKQRADAIKELRLLSQSVILPKIESMTASSVPATENVLPMSVVNGTRGYIEKVVVQANGTYEHQWYDACSVMIRRLVETLIIEVYEAKNKAHEIKGSDGNYLMLSHLVDRLLADSFFHLGRETKRGLPLIKSIGDRSAHNRHFLAKKEDLDKVTHDLRVAVDELLNLAGLK